MSAKIPESLYTHTVHVYHFCERVRTVSRVVMGRQFVVQLLCLKLLPQFSSHLNEACYTWSLCRVDVHTMRHGQGVPELCPSLTSNIIIYRKCFVFKLLSKFSNWQLIWIRLFMVCLISCDNVRSVGILITISGSSS